MPKGWPKGRSGIEEEKAVKHGSPVVFLSEQRRNSSKFHQMEILELKRTVSEMKVILDRYTRMLQPILEDRSTGITHSEEQKEKTKTTENQP